MPDDINAELEAVEAKSSKLPIIIGAVVLLLLGLGGGAFIAMQMSDSGSAAGEEEKAEDGKAEGEESAANPPALFNLGLFTINLRGTGGGRVLRMEVQVQADAGVVETLEERKPEFRHSIITMVSDYSYNDLEGRDGKVRLADELLARLNRHMETGRINRLYFVQFVIQ